MCGKDFPDGSSRTHEPGSPPHVRERLPIPAAGRRHHGITPACAGKTLVMMFKDFNMRDHPRMCGKDLRQPSKTLLPPGSPPHVRERPFPVYDSQQKDRITPACAGKTRYVEEGATAD